MDFDMNFLHHHGKKCPRLRGVTEDHRAKGSWARAVLGRVGWRVRGDNLHHPEKMLWKPWGLEALMGDWDSRRGKSQVTAELPKGLAVGGHS